MVEEYIEFRNHVRKRPGMYWGSAGALGLETLICEVAGNPLDLFLHNQVTQIKIELDGYRVTVEDDGPGFPFETIGLDGKTPFVEYHFTRVHHTPSIGQVPHVHMTHLNGMGLAPVNYLSRELIVQSRRDGKLWQQRFVDGFPDGAAKVLGIAEGSGTIVQLEIAQEFFGNEQPSRERLRQIFLETIHLFPGLRIQFGAENFYSVQGLADLAKLECTLSQRGEPFYLNAPCGDVLLQAAAIGKQKRQPTCHAWVNGVKMVDGGTHVDAFRAALKRVKYNPSSIYIHAVMLDPEFAGPMRNSLHVPQLQAQIEEGLFAALLQWRNTRQQFERIRPKGFAHN